MRRNNGILAAFLVGILSLLMNAEAQAQEPGLRRTLTAVTPTALPPQTAEFNFWKGKWKVTEEGTGTTGKSTVKDFGIGIALTESYKVGDLSRESVTVYDTPASAWTQTYSDSNGLIIQMKGIRQNNEIVLEGEFTDPVDDRVKLGRLSYHIISKKKFDQVLEVSIDDGQSWQVVFITHWKKKKG